MGAKIKEQIMIVGWPGMRKKLEICPNCGKEAYDGEFCKECGYECEPEIESEETETETEETEIRRVNHSGRRREIRRVKIIGVRTAEETRGLGNVNFGIYSFLIEYGDGSVGIREAQLGRPEMAELLAYVRFDG